MAVIWVTKASKGSTQWTDDGTQRQLSHYRFRKKMKPLTVLIKTIYLGGLGGFTNLGRWDHGDIHFTGYSSLTTGYVLGY